jgi:hypothetical protein
MERSPRRRYSATSAAAHKLAHIVYRMITLQQQYHARFFNSRCFDSKNASQKKLRAQAKEMGSQVLPAKAVR